MTNAADLPFVIKICGVTNKDDARLAVDAGANALGFNFYTKSPRYIQPDRAHDIAAAVSGAFLKVGLFVNPTPQDLLTTAESFPFDIVQLHGDGGAFFPANSYRLWRSVSPYSAVEDSAAEAYVLDTPSRDFGGSGKSFDWKVAAGRSYRVILAGGLDASNVTEAIRIAQPWGVDACSRLESSPGKKDVQRVRDFVQTALAASGATEEIAL